MLQFLVALLSLHTVFSAAPEISVIRGLDPSLRSLFKGQEFACRDGSKKIPAARVNDDYCDCADGSDEPGMCIGCLSCTVLISTDHTRACRDPYHNPAPVTCRHVCMLLRSILLLESGA